MDKTEKDIDFVARHYRKDCFNARAGWERLGLGLPARRRRLRFAAAVGAAVILSASAAIIFHQQYNNRRPEPASNIEVPADRPTLNPLNERKVIDFDNASLSMVVERIEEVYQVHVENVPANAAEYTLTLHYEGTPGDLIEVINDLLGTQMTIANP